MLCALLYLLVRGDAACSQKNNLSFQKTMLFVSPEMKAFFKQEHKDYLREHLNNLLILAVETSQCGFLLTRTDTWMKKLNISACYNAFQLFLKHVADSLERQLK